MCNYIRRADDQSTFSLKETTIEKKARCLRPDIRLQAVQLLDHAVGYLLLKEAWM